MASAALGQAETASPTLVAETPRVPAVGIEIPEDTRLALRERTDALGQAIDQLRDQLTETPPLLRFLPDVQVYHKAVDWALRHRLFFKEGEFKTAEELLAEGTERAKQLANGKTPWTRQPGLIVRGYISCLLYTSPSPRDATLSRMPSSA